MARLHYVTANSRNNNAKPENQKFATERKEEQINVIQNLRQIFKNVKIMLNLPLKCSFLISGRPFRRRSRSCSRSFSLSLMLRSRSRSRDVRRRYEPRGERLRERERERRRRPRSRERERLRLRLLRRREDL